MKILKKFQSSTDHLFSLVKKSFIRVILFIAVIYGLPSSVFAQTVFDTPDMPTTMVVGQSYQVSLSVKTMEPYYAQLTVCALASVNPLNNSVWGRTRIPVLLSSDGSRSFTFNFDVVAPSAAGTYHFQWQLNCDNKWLGGPTPDVVVNVVQPNVPVINMVSPTANQTFYSSRSYAPYVILGAEANASPGAGATLTKLELLEGENVLGSKQINDNYLTAVTGAVTAGSHAVRLRVTDSLGRTATTESVRIGAGYADDLAPYSEIVLPGDRTRYFAPEGAKASVPLLARSYSSTGGVSYSQVFDGATLVGTYLGHEINSTIQLAAGEHSLRVKAVDWGGVAGTFSPPIIVIVSNQNRAPDAFVRNPYGGLVLEASDNDGVLFPVSARATDPDGGFIINMQLLDNGNVIGTASNGEWDQTVKLAVGAHDLQVIATDDSNGVGVGESIVTVVPPGQLVRFNYVVPTSSGGGVLPGEKLKAGLHANVQTNSSTPPDAVVSVELREESNVLGKQTFAVRYDPEDNQVADYWKDFTLYSDFPIGVHRIYLRLYTLHGVMDSPVYTITVTNKNLPPTPTINSPAQGTTVIVPDLYTEIKFSGTGTDQDGFVSKLELMQGDVVVAQTSSATLDASVLLRVGDYSFSLRATDNNGGVAVSQPRNFSVRQGALLGAVSDVRGNASGNLEVVGWACESGASQGLNVQVTSRTGDVLGYGRADVATEGDNLAVQSKCQTPGAAHHFVIELNSLANYFSGEFSLTVQAQPPSNSAWQALPCSTASSCASPGFMRIAVVAPVNGDSYIASSEIVARVKISNGSPPYNGVFIVVDEQSYPASEDTDGTYIVRLNSLAASSTSHSFSGVVNQGPYTLASAKTLAYVTASGSTGLALVAPVSSNRAEITRPLELSAKEIGAANLIRDVKFYINNAIVVPAVKSGDTWRASWTTPVPGPYSVVARAYNGSGAQLAQSESADITFVRMGPSVAVNAPVAGNEYWTSVASANAVVRLSATATAADSNTVSNFEVIEGASSLKSIGASNTMDSAISLAVGKHVLQFRATDNAGTSGLSAEIPIEVFQTVSGVGSQFVSQVVPTAMLPGESNAVIIKMRNTGSVSWSVGSQFRLGSTNPQDTRLWNSTGRADLSESVSTGGVATFTIPIKAPTVPGTYNFQWRMVQDGTAWFGASSENVAIVVTASEEPVATLNASPANSRVPPGQSGTVSLTGAASAMSGVLSTLEVFVDSGSGYGVTPVKAIAGNTAKLALKEALSLTSGSYRLKLRATDSGGHVGESEPVVLNFTDSPLLGQVLGVRSNGTQQLQLLGWACRDASAAALSYKVYVEAPPALGGVEVASGVADRGGEAGDESVQVQCHTPGVSHSFAVDIAGLQAQYPGAPLYVTANSLQGEMIVLPCEDHGCRIPEGLRIGLTSPSVSNLDRFYASIPAFARAVVTGYTGTLDEVSFNINGEWLAATAEGAGAYSVSKTGLPASALPYAAYAKVRQGETTLMTDSHLFYVDPGMEPSEISPHTGTTVPLGSVTLLSTVIKSTVEAGQSVKFYVVPKAVAQGSSLVADATFDGTKWSYSWQPKQEGSYTVVAKLVDAAGTVLMATPPATLVVSNAATPSGPEPLPVVVKPPALENGVGGTLPGNVSVSNSGGASYSLPIQVPPGILGMVPSISLNYDSNDPSGIAGLGWSIGGISRVDRCGPTFATDKKSDAVRFEVKHLPYPLGDLVLHPDRLCLNGQRLVLVNGTADNDDDYWAVGAEFRTEVESFTRVTAFAADNGQRAFKVETKDGHTSYFGETKDSFIEAVNRTDGMAHRWYVNRTTDRSGNAITYAYNEDATTGESTLDTVSWGANTAEGTANFAKVKFTYEARPDPRQAYLAGNRVDERLRLQKIETSVDSTDNSTGGWVPALTYTLAYARSPSSGRSLLQSVSACDFDSRCLPATQFHWGEADPAAVRGFVKLGEAFDGPALDNLPGEGDYKDAVIAADFNGDGRTDLLERFSSTGNGTQRLFQRNADGSWTVKTPFASVAGSTQVIDVGDFNGDGLLDILVGDMSGNAKLCFAQSNGDSYSCSAASGVPADMMQSYRLLKKFDLVGDFNGDGKDDLFIRNSNLRDSASYRSMECMANGTGFDCTDSTRKSNEKYLDWNMNGGPMGPTAYTDVDGDGRVDAVLIPRCARLKDEITGRYAWKCATTGFGEDLGGVIAFGQPNTGIPQLDGNWLPYPNVQTAVVPQLMGGTLIGDFNADGYSDMIFGTVTLQSGGAMVPGQGALCLSRGNGGADCYALPSTATVGGTDQSYLPLMVGDFDGDGKLDVLRPQDDAWATANVAEDRYQLCHIGMNNDSSGQLAVLQNCEAWKGPVFYGVSRKQAYQSGETPTLGVYSNFMGDFDGDGRQDIVTYLGGGKWQVYASAAQAKPNEALDKLVSVVNGIGNTERVDYALANDPSVYQSKVARPDNQNNVGKLTYPGRPLVKTIHRDNGIADTRDTTYSYARMAMDPGGRGSLGFAEVRATDVNRGVITFNWPCLEFPFIGKECNSLQQTAEGVSLRKTTNVWGQRTTTYAGGGIAYLPYQTTSTTVLRDPSGPDLGTSVTTMAEPDAWGNVLDISVVSSSDTNTAGWTATRHMTYDNDSTTWRLGELRKLTETRANDYNTVSRDTTYGYDSLGRLETEVRVGDETQNLTTTYDRSTVPFGLVAKTKLAWTDPASHSPMTRTVSDVTYTANGRFVASATNAAGHVEQRTFDSRSGAMASVKDANGLTTTITADGFGRVLASIAPDGTVMEASVKRCDSECPAGATSVTVRETKRSTGERVATPVLEFADNAGHAVRTLTWGFDGSKIVADKAYDALGRLYKVFWPRFTSDALSALSSDPADAFLQTQTTYDALDHPLLVMNKDEVGQDWYTVYTRGGLNLMIANPRGQQTTETRDVWGRLAKIVDANGKTTTFQSDAFGNLTKTTDSKGNVVIVTYDGWGRRTQLQDPDLGIITYGVDALGQVWNQISPKQSKNHAQTTMAYDALGRMTSRSASDLVAQWTYDLLPGQTGCSTYHSCGRLVGSNTQGGVAATDFRQEHTYDVFGRPDTTSTWLDTAYTTKLGYDAWGRLSREEYQRSGSTVKAYDRRYNAWGQLARIERSGQAIWTAKSLDAAQRVTSASLGNGLEVLRYFNAYTGRLESGSAGDKLAESYHYDEIGNVKQRSQQWGSTSFIESFGYDGLNRLREATIGNNATQVFLYNDIGNIVSKTGVGTGDYVYPDSGKPQPHAVSSIPGIGKFTYDDNGNMETGAGRTVSWSSFDMPVTISNGSGESSTFYYGPDYQRIKQVRADATIWYAGAMEVEIGTGGGPTTVKTYLPNGLGVEIDKGGTPELNYTHLDRLGSVVAISDESGVIVETLAYDSWGKRRELTSPSTPDRIDGERDNKGFTGHEMLDKLDLVHMNGRVYDPLVARFLSADPIIQDPTQSQSYNRYTYVWNNPTNLTDPTGFMGEGDANSSSGETVCNVKCRAEKAVIAICNTMGMNCISIGTYSDDGKSKDKTEKPAPSASAESGKSLFSMASEFLGSKDYSGYSDQSLLSGCLGGNGGQCEALTFRREDRGEVPYSMNGLILGQIENNLNVLPVESLALRLGKEVATNAFAKDKYENPGHHDSSGGGPNPYNGTKSVLPKNHEDLWQMSRGASDGNRWTKVGKGKNAEYHRFQNDGNGNWHWNGSTAGMTQSGQSRTIRMDQVPIEVKRW